MKVHPAEVATVVNWDSQDSAMTMLSDEETAAPPVAEDPPQVDADSIPPAQDDPPTQPAHTVLPT